MTKIKIINRSNKADYIEILFNESETQFDLNGQYILFDTPHERFERNNIKSGSKKVSVELSEEDYEKLKIICIHEKKTLSGMLRMLINKHLDIVLEDYKN